MQQSLWETLQALGGFGSQQLSEVGIVPLLTLLGISLLASLFISYLYVTFYRSRATGSEVHRAFPLIGIAITAIFISIQFSLPLSFGLLGALSIVRFRTPIKEPEEIGFILVVIAASLSVATFNMVLLGIILTVTVVALLILRFGPALLGRHAGDGVVVVTLPKDDSNDKLGELVDFLQKTLPQGRIDSVSESDGQSTISYSFLRLEPGLLPEIQDGVRAIAASSQSTCSFIAPGTSRHDASRHAKYGRGCHRCDEPDRLYWRRLDAGTMGRLRSYKGRAAPRHPAV